MRHSINELKRLLRVNDINEQMFNKEILRLLALIRQYPSERDKQSELASDIVLLYQILLQRLCLIDGSAAADHKVSYYHKAIILLELDLIEYDQLWLETFSDDDSLTDADWMRIRRLLEMIASDVKDPASTSSRKLAEIRRLQKEGNGLIILDTAESPKTITLVPIRIKTVDKAQESSHPGQDRLRSSWHWD